MMFFAEPLAWSPIAVIATVMLVSPGIHIVLSVAVERRRIRWQDDYPAVLVGDPALAVAAGLAATIAGEGAAARSALASPYVGFAAVGIGWSFGAWQIRQEVRGGRYTRLQALSPTKLWHQFGVYPLLGWWIPSLVITGVREARSGVDQVLLVALVALVGLWVVLATQAVRGPRLGHGAFDWRQMRAVPIAQVRRPGSCIDETAAG